VSQAWVELKFEVPTESSEQWAALLVEEGAPGVEERDAATLDKPAAGRVGLVVWIAPDEVEAFLARVKAASASAGLPEAEVARRDRDEDEWRDAWKRHFAPRPVGRFVIVPSWERYEAKPGEIVLDLDPGRAFGTGGHATTRLCLRAIDELERCARFLDAGCGSGILAIAAAKRWPEARGEAYDVDREAIEVAVENAARNGVGPERVRWSTDTLGQIRGEFDVILANIQPEVLIPIAEELAARRAPGGRIFLSGILVEAAPPVVAAYEAVGCRLVEERVEDGWVLLVLA
jgi:ribosomal protein L11 methyltransferase